MLGVCFLLDSETSSLLGFFSIQECGFHRVEILCCGLGLLDFLFDWFGFGLDLSGGRLVRWRKLERLGSFGDWLRCPKLTLQKHLKVDHRVGLLFYLLWLFSFDWLFFDWTGDSLLNFFLWFNFFDFDGNSRSLLFSLRDNFSVFTWTFRFCRQFLGLLRLLRC